MSLGKWRSKCVSVGQVVPLAVGVTLSVGCRSDLDELLSKSVQPSSDDDTFEPDGGLQPSTGPGYPESGLSPQPDSGRPVELIDGGLGEPAPTEPSNGGSAGAGTPAGGAGGAGGVAGGIPAMGGESGEGGSGGTPMCVPDCDGRQCGDDGCGASCGVCAGGEVCSADRECLLPELEFELENAAHAGSAGKSTMGSGWSGSGFADFNGNGSMSLSLEPGAGSYDLDFTYAARSARDLEITVNGSIVRVHTFVDTGDWFSTWKAESVPRVTLTSGVNLLELRTNGDGGPNLDRLRVKPALGYELQVEAEDADTTDCTAVIDADGGRAVSDCPLRSVNTYTVDVPSSGVATFSVRASTVDQGAQIYLIDASNKTLAFFNLTPYGLTTYRTYSIQVNIPTSGSQSMKIRSERSTAHLNWWRLEQ